VNKETKKKIRIAEICYSVKYLKAAFKTQACLAVWTFPLFRPCLEHTAYHFRGFAFLSVGEISQWNVAIRGAMVKTSLWAFLHVSALGACMYV
jgi:hypothetical protein